MTSLTMSLVAAIPILTVLAAPAAATNALDRHRWTSRLIVIAAADPADPRIADQRRRLNAAGRGVRERDLVVVEATGNGGEAAAIRQRLGIAPDGFTVVLVGKDGGSKLSSREPLSSDRLFAEIDSMPMRQDEMRRNAAAEVKR